MYHIQELVELGFVRIDIRNIYIKDHDSWHCIKLFLSFRWSRSTCMLWSKIPDIYRQGSWN